MLCNAIAIPSFTFILCPNILIPVLVDKGCLVDGHHAVRPRSCLIGRSLLLREMMANHSHVHLRLGYTRKQRKWIKSIGFIEFTQFTH